jgi:hypothetical protein
MSICRQIFSLLIASFQVVLVSQEPDGLGNNCEHNAAIALLSLRFPLIPTKNDKDAVSRPYRQDNFQAALLRASHKTKHATLSHKQQRSQNKTKKKPKTSHVEEPQLQDCPESIFEYPPIDRSIDQIELFAKQLVGDKLLERGITFIDRLLMKKDMELRRLDMILQFFAKDKQQPKRRNNEIREMLRRLYVSEVRHISSDERLSLKKHQDLTEHKIFLIRQNIRENRSLEELEWIFRQAK